MTSLLARLPARRFNQPMIRISTSNLLVMERELREEISLLRCNDDSLLELAAKRNGLAAVQYEITLRTPL